MNDKTGLQRDRERPAKRERRVFVCEEKAEQEVKIGGYGRS